MDCLLKGCGGVLKHRGGDCVEMAAGHGKCVRGAMICDKVCY